MLVILGQWAGVLEMYGRYILFKHPIWLAKLVTFFDSPASMQSRQSKNEVSTLISSCFQLFSINLFSHSQPQYIVQYKGHPFPTQDEQPIAQLNTWCTHRGLFSTIVCPQAEKSAFVVGDLGALIRQHVHWQSAAPQLRPYYPVKCNSSPAVVEVLASLGLGFVCANKVRRWLSNSIQGALLLQLL